MAKFYVTTAIDYVNAAPHIGHAYEKIAADVFARWHRMKGDEVHFLTGTDENAQKNEQAAREAGIPVKEFVDRNSRKFIELCRLLSLSNDDFIRTTEERHVKAAQLIFKRIFDRGDIYKGAYQGLYCVGCESFVTEKDLVDGKCPEHGKEPQMIKEDAYFFRMSRYTDRVLELLKSPAFVMPESRRKEMVNRVESEGLKDLCVSRTGLDWGVDTPIDPEYKIYVWIDALSNYVTALGYPDGRLYKKFWPADMHMIGKGINWFHTVIWPSILMAADVPVPKQVYVHGYVNIEGAKISKSLGATVDPVKLVKQYGADAVRYFLMREIPFGEDGNFSEDALKARINGELVGDLGNMLNRVLTIADKFSGEIGGKDELNSKLDFRKISGHMDKRELHHALERIFDFIRQCNKYINDREPWKLEGKDLGNVLYNLLESLRIISILVEPFVPGAAGEMNKQLGVKAGTHKDLKFRPFTGKPKKGKLLFEKVK
jgi:methionyl-tRNA synthetase